VARLADPVTRTAAAADQAREAFLAGRFPRLPWLERLAPGAAKTFLPLAVVAGGIDAYHGGGHAGTRGAVTRILGAGAAVAGVALLAGAAPPVAVAAGAVLVAHATWTAGGKVWDHRRQIGGFLQRAGSAAVGAARAAGRRASDTARGVRSFLRDGLRGLAGGSLPRPIG
jgi:hypothetical protein